MANLNELVEDYSRHQVPAEKKVTGIRIATIIVGVAITLPAFLAGSQLGQQLGIERGALAFALGGGVVTIVGAFTGMVGAKAGLSTAMIIKFAFGRRGAMLVNLVLLAAFFGWFGVTVSLFAEAAQAALAPQIGVPVPRLILVLLGSLLMILVTIFGFKALDKLSLIAVPLMLAFLAVIGYLSTQVDQWAVATATQTTVGLAASAVAGGFMVGATMMPDLCRYARSTGHAVAASVLAYAVGYPLVLMMAAIPAAATGQADLIQVILSLGLGMSGFMLVVFASLTTNASNLYSSSLVLSAMISSIDRWKLVVIAGGLGTVFAALGIMDRFMQFLLLLGVVIPPIGGIFVADYFVARRRGYELAALADNPAICAPAIGAWLLASGLGFVTTFGEIRLSGVPAVDSVLAAFALNLALTKVLKS